jgi:hypothetical protein
MKLDYRISEFHSVDGRSRRSLALRQRATFGLARCPSCLPPISNPKTARRLAFPDRLIPASRFCCCSISFAIALTTNQAFTSSKYVRSLGWSVPKAYRPRVNTTFNPKAANCSSVQSNSSSDGFEISGHNALSSSLKFTT